MMNLSIHLPNAVTEVEGLNYLKISWKIFLLCVLFGDTSSIQRRIKGSQHHPSLFVFLHNSIS